MARKFTSIALVGATLFGALSLGGCDARQNDSKVGSADQTPGLESNSRSAQSTIDQSPTAAGIQRAASTSSPSLFLSVTDINLLQQAAQKGLFEIETAKLASKKAKDPTLKAYASELHSDQLVAATKLQQVARRYNVNLPSAIASDQQPELTQLNQMSGTAFDKQFAQTVAVQDLENVITFFEDAIRQCTNPEVKAYFDSVLPTLRAQLIAARQLPQVSG